MAVRLPLEVKGICEGDDNDTDGKKADGDEDEAEGEEEEDDHGDMVEEEAEVSMVSSIGKMESNCL